ncbi:MAG: hypothetical protein EOO92_08205 [Pedobacter sp.]|nr:MAG: hypothetical protein EOO92_08205 [Pedobacter sp.]
MKKTLLFLFAFVFVFSSCSTNEAITCYLPDITSTSNSPLVPGGTLQLRTPFDEGSDLNYIWTGPNNFQSNLPNPIITNVTTAMAGEYKVKMTKGICESKESSTLVEITAPDIPCNPKKNTLDIKNSSALNFSSVYTSNYNTDFKIIASGSEATLTIEFADEDTPTPGVYRITTQRSSSMKKDEVYISLNYGEYTSAENSGLLYLSSSNGKFNAVFCDVIFKPLVFTFNTSANLTEN